VDFHESIAAQIAKERIADALREADQLRAIRLAGRRRVAWVRLGNALVRLGHWMSGQSSSAPSEQTTGAGWAASVKSARIQGHH